MKWLDRIAGKLGYVNRSNLRVVRRGYAGASINRLTADWLACGTTGDAELKQSIKLLRDRCRQLERDDDYMVRYLSLAENNVLGSCGIKLQMKVVDPVTGKQDKGANDAIEKAWEKWGRPETCTARKTISWRTLCGLALRSALRDGGSLTEKLEGFGNNWGYAVNPLEMDHLDTDMEVNQPGSRRIRMGVELDAWDAPLGYHIFTQHPGQIAGRTVGQRARRFVPAERLIHLFRPNRISQVIGAPAPSATIQRLKMLSGYEEAELIAAREAACKGYGIKQATPEGYQGVSDSQGRQLENVEPGMGLLLEPGEEYFGIDPQHPVEAFPSFTKAILRAIAGGLGVSYTSLANDLEGVNYSSIRAGLLEEREEWKSLQEWFIAGFITPIFEDWLGWSLFQGKILLANGSALPFRKLEQFNQPYWQGRRWPWVDPLKDVQADILAIAARLKSRRQVITEDGGDVETIDEEFANDPVTKGIDSESVYAPNSQPEPTEGNEENEGGKKVPGKSGDGRWRKIQIGDVSLTEGGLLNGKDH